MVPDNLLALATMRHELSRMPRIASWFNLDDGRSAVVVTKIETSGGRPMAKCIRFSTGTPSPVIAARMAAAQAHVDEALRQSFGAAWEDVWHECALVSLACDAGEELLLRCRAMPQTARRVVAAFDESRMRVRARLVAPSTEFPRLATEVRAICHRPAALAA